MFSQCQLCMNNVSNRCFMMWSNWEDWGWLIQMHSQRLARSTVATCTLVFTIYFIKFSCWKEVYTAQAKYLLRLVRREDDLKIIPEVCFIPYKKQEMNRGSTVFRKHISSIVLFFGNLLLFLLVNMCAFLCCALSVKMVYFYYYHYTILPLLSTTNNVNNPLPLISIFLWSLWSCIMWTTKQNEHFLSHIALHRVIY